MVFQSTLPRRERLHSRSIHLCLLYFNPRSREGSDSSALDPQDTLLLFQSTLPRRERRILYKFRLQRDQISIHAPAKGATRTWETSSLAWQFQSTLPRRERHPCGCIGYFNCNNFNPRSREGSDGEKLPQRAWLEYFNPRSREGSDGYEADIRI